MPSKPEVNIQEQLLEGTETAASLSHSRSIPSLDGLRAVAISFVLLAHHGERVAKTPQVSAYLFELGGGGVYLFFIISGFLITFLLRREKTATDGIDLKSFYLRRTLRIFPPYYTYLGVVLVLWGFGFPERWQNIAAAATYTSNYYLPPIGPMLSSTWSLGLEEQFYLFWPVCLKYLNLKQARWLALWLIALMPISRTLTYHFFPALHAAGRVSGMLQTRVDTLMFGCLLALLVSNTRFEAFLTSALRPWTFHAAWVSAFVILPILHGFFGMVYRFFYLTLDGLALTWVIIYVVMKPASLPGRFLNLRPVKYLGVLSYSIYLYQQIFVDSVKLSLPLALPATLAAAMCSYYLVEKPVLRLRDRLVSRYRSKSGRVILSS